MILFPASSCARVAISLLVAAVIASPASAQWSDDPTASLRISDIGLSIGLPIVMPAVDDGFYVSWITEINSPPSDAPREVYLQRLDANGNALWGQSGIPIGEVDTRAAVASGLAVDAAGDAYVAVKCCSVASSTNYVSLHRITRKGALPWGPEGIRVDPTAGSGSVFVTATNDDAVVVVWEHNNEARAQKFDANGVASWAAGGVLVNQGTILDTKASDNGSVIVSSQVPSGTFDRIVLAQKFAGADGAPLWNQGTPVRVFDTGLISPSESKSFTTDGNGGAVFWNNVAFEPSSFSTPRAQHLDADGNALLTAKGVAASSEFSGNEISASFDPVGGDIYLLWHTRTESEDGISAQRIDASGQLRWGDVGKVVVPLTGSTDGTQVISGVVALPAPGGFMATWLTGISANLDLKITAARIDADGHYAWPMQKVEMARTDMAVQLTGTVSHRGVFGYTWAHWDLKGEPAWIEAQNLNPDGSMGLGSLPTHTVGGTITGWKGSGLVLRLNGDSDLEPTANGTFVFQKALADGSTYLISIASQPSNSEQICRIVNDEGIVAHADVTSIRVTCGSRETVFTDGFDLP